MNSLLPHPAGWPSAFDDPGCMEVTSTSRIPSRTSSTSAHQRPGGRSGSTSPAFRDGLIMLPTRAMAPSWPISWKAVSTSGAHPAQRAGCWSGIGPWRRPAGTPCRGQCTLGQGDRQSRTGPAHPKQRSTGSGGRRTGPWSPGQGPPFPAAEARPASLPPAPGTRSLLPWVRSGAPPRAAGGPAAQPVRPVHG